MVYLNGISAGVGSVLIVFVLFIAWMMTRIKRTAGLGAVYGYTIANPLFWFACMAAFAGSYWWATRA
jgi:hypothetical protein